MSGIPERVWKLKLPCHVDNAIMKHMETIIKKIDRNQIDHLYCALLPDKYAR